jgi:hypothetical protein
MLKRVAVLLLLPALAWGQSLAEVAQKEKERRKQNEAKGVKARVVTEEDLKAGKGQLANDPGLGGATVEAPSPSTAASPSSPAGASTAPAPAPSPGGGSAPPQASPAPSPEAAPPMGTRAEWQAKVAVVLARISNAKRRHEELRARLARSSSRKDAAGNPVVSKELETQVAAAWQELESARKEIDSLRELGRRAGIPDDWLR